MIIHSKKHINIMKRISLIFIYSCFLSVLGWAQPNNEYLGNVVMPAPNAASLGKYGDIPVSYYTGVPNISIPIHTLEEGNLTLPISLSYHSSGVKVGEMSSWVGLGWSLQAGGMITRTTQGLRDETPAGYYNKGDELVNPTNYASTSAYSVGEVIRGSVDSEPDIFHFNFAGYSGKFAFDGDKTPYFIPKQNLKLEVLENDPFDGFVIITPDGTRYIFGEHNNISLRETTEVNGYGANVSSWYLVKIESADQNYAIDFEYEAERYEYKSLATVKKIYSNCGFLTGTNSEGTLEWSTLDNYNYNGLHYYTITRINGWRLKKNQNIYI